MKSEFIRHIRNCLTQNLTGILSSIAVCTGFFILWLWGKVVEKNYGGVIPKQTNFLIIGIVFFIWSITFIIVIWRKEAPVLFPMEGKSAVIFGIIGLLISLFFSISFFLKYWGVF